MKPTEAFAPAKINLTLHVTGQRDDGYHLLDSLVVFADIGDRLWLEPADTMHLEVTGPYARGVPTDNRNLMWRAAVAAGVTLCMRLEKNLPSGAGIGGGSSDAAAVLRHFGAVDDAEALGADVPVCLNPLPQRMRGIGAELSVAQTCPQWDMVLVNPGVEVLTPQVFQALTSKENTPMDALPDTPSRSLWLDWLALQRNDLEAPATLCAPVIVSVLHSLIDARLARMSGSGATCFGLFDSPADAQAAATVIKANHPDWWVVAGRTLASK